MEGQLTDIEVAVDSPAHQLSIPDTPEQDKKEEGKKKKPGKIANPFMRIDKQGNLLSNFFSNFFSQLKNPARLSLSSLPNKGILMWRRLVSPKDDEKGQDEKKATQDNKQQLNDKTMATKAKKEETAYRYQPDQLDWETMANLGLSKEKLEKMKILDPLLKGYKTNDLIPVSLNLGTAITKLDARLSLQLNNEGKVAVNIHGIRKAPNLNHEFFGHSFSKEDKENLLQSGNMGRVVNLKNPKTGDEIPSIISVDKKTNELIALRTEYMQIPGEIKGVKIKKKDKQTLMEGKPLRIEGMTSKKGTAFDADVQYNADKRHVEFLFDRDNPQSQTQENSKTNEQTPPGKAPKTFRGLDLDKEQYKKFKSGETIFLQLEDRKGKPYQGYITFNKETGKTSFAFQNPDKLKEQVKPARETAPKKAKAEKSSKKQKTETPKAPAKSKGRKM